MKMRPLYGLFLSALLSFLSPLAYATDGGACAESYRALYENFDRSLAELKSRQSDPFIKGTILGVTAYGICAYLFRAGIICGGALGTGLVAGQTGENQVNFDIGLLQDSRRIFEIYSHVGANNTTSGPATDLFEDLRVPLHMKGALAHYIRNLMDSGELCAEGVPVKSFDEFTNLLRERMGAL